MCASGHKGKVVYRDGRRPFFVDNGLRGGAWVKPCMAHKQKTLAGPEGLASVLKEKCVLSLGIEPRSKV